ncbi:hypothetical protein R1sor_025347 [Riccia sorocarpa]|uniref:Uncharacterized protein n=1 Tax=Riccia sorocarpa TaxID=122646 RepID=A0ABD3GCA2_9MARC
MALFVFPEREIVRSWSSSELATEVESYLNTTAERTEILLQEGIDGNEFLSLSLDDLHQSLKFSLWQSRKILRWIEHYREVTLNSGENPPSGITSSSTITVSQIPVASMCTPPLLLPEEQNVLRNVGQEIPQKLSISRKGSQGVRTSQRPPQQPKVSRQPRAGRSSTNPHAVITGIAPTSKALGSACVGSTIGDDTSIDSLMWRVWGKKPVHEKALWGRDFVAEFHPLAKQNYDTAIRVLRDAFEKVHIPVVGRASKSDFRSNKDAEAQTLQYIEEVCAELEPLQFLIAGVLVAMPPHPPFILKGWFRNHKRHHSAKRIQQIDALGTEGERDAELDCKSRVRENIESDHSVHTGFDSDALEDVYLDKPATGTEIASSEKTTAIVIPPCISFPLPLLNEDTDVDIEGESDSKDYFSVLTTRPPCIRTPLPSFNENTDADVEVTDSEDVFTGVLNPVTPLAQKSIEYVDNVSPTSVQTSKTVCESYSPSSSADRRLFTSAELEVLCSPGSKKSGHSANTDTTAKITRGKRSIEELYGRTSLIEQVKVEKSIGCSKKAKNTGVHVSCSEFENQKVIHDLKRFDEDGKLTVAMEAMKLRSKQQVYPNLAKFIAQKNKTGSRKNQKLPFIGHLQASKEDLLDMVVIWALENKVELVKLPAPVDGIIRLYKQNVQFKEKIYD